MSRPFRLVSPGLLACNNGQLSRPGTVWSWMPLLTWLEWWGWVGHMSSVYSRIGWTFSHSTWVPRENPNVQVIFKPLLVLMFMNISLTKVSQCKFRTKGWRNRFHFLMGRNCQILLPFFFFSTIRAESDKCLQYHIYIKNIETTLWSI